MLQDVLHPQADFWKLNPSIESNSCVSWQAKQEIAQSYLTKRCEEELELLKSDMCATIQYWSDRVTRVSTKLEEIICSGSQYERGVRCVLLHLKMDAECQHQRAASAFTKMIPIPGRVESTSSGALDDSDTESEDTDTELEDTELEDSDSDMDV